jgi:hypothetical protein
MDQKWLRKSWNCNWNSKSIEASRSHKNTPKRRNEIKEMQSFAYGSVLDPFNGIYIKV